MMADAAAMLPPTESPATAMRVASRPSAAPFAARPARGRVGLLDRHRVPGLGGTVVLDEGDRGVGTDGQLPHEHVVRPGVAQDPASAVNAEDDQQARGCTDRFDDADLGVAPSAGTVIHVSSTSSFSTGAAWMSSSTMLAPSGPSS